MAFDPIGAGITAGVGLIGGLFASAEESERQKRQFLFESQQQGFQRQAAGIQALQTGQQTAFKDLISGFRGALL